MATVSWSCPPRNKDFINSKVWYFPAPPEDKQCLICLKFTGVFDHEPAYLLSTCRHAFHEQCLVTWLSRSNVFPVKNCLKCRDFHYKVQWQGPILQSFPGTDLPDIREKIGYEELAQSIQRVKAKLLVPWLQGDTLRTPPERVKGGLRISKEAFMQQVKAEIVERERYRCRKAFRMNGPQS